MTPWRVWPAGRDDAAALVRLEKLSFGERSWGENSLKESFVTPGVTVFLGGEPDGGALGFAILRDLGAEAEVLSLGVAPQVRKSGLGRALLAALMTAARDGGAKNLFLEVDAGNRAALALYQGAAFESVGRRRTYYRNGADAIIMRLAF